MVLKVVSSGTGGGGGSGTVTSVTGNGTVNGITLTGAISGIMAEDSLPTGVFIWSTWVSGQKGLP